MSQLRLSFVTEKQKAEKIADALGEHPDFDALPIAAFENNAENQNWRVAIYCAPDQGEASRDKLEDWLAAHSLNPAIEYEELPETGWVEKNLEILKPVRAGRFVVHGSHDADKVKTGEIGIGIDAAMAFGTGHHGTTVGCLDMITELAKARHFSNALDLGTGSAVLAIALAKLGARKIIASDIDPVAIDAARHNIKNNGVDAFLRPVIASGFDHRSIRQTAPYDLIVANILAEPLYGLATQMARHIAPGGHLILSGLLPHQRRRILARYRSAGFVHLASRIRDGWLVLLLAKA